MHASMGRYLFFERTILPLRSSVTPISNYVSKMVVEV